jgi:hypothetical protein
MAIINKTGITNGGTIQAEHVTRAIDALSGVSTDTVVATGSFTGSFQGILTGTVNGNSSTATAVNTAAGSDNSTHYVLFANNTTGNQTPLTDTNLTFNPNTNALTLTGSLTASGSLNISATATSKINLSAISSSGYFALPVSQPSNPVTGSVYVDFTAGNFAIWDGATWRPISF